MKSLHYAGIGSRETPASVCTAMTHIAHRLRESGYTLRSGGARGADTAFEKGAGDASVIYLPWPKFNDHRSPHHYISVEAKQLAGRFHPMYPRLEPHAQALIARNGYQILGLDLKSPVDFVVCWTPKGKGGGGTGQAIRIAQGYNIPVYDLAAWSARAVLDRVLNAS